MSPEYNFHLRTKLNSADQARKLQELLGLIEGVVRVDILAPQSTGSEKKPGVISLSDAMSKIGSMGGIARANKLGPEERSVIARKAANARWHPEITTISLNKESSKNPAAVALGKLGGKKGGVARSAKLSPDERSESARRAVNVRWHPPTS